MVIFHSYVSLPEGIPYQILVYIYTYSYEMVLDSNKAPNTQKVLGSTYVLR